MPKTQTTCPRCRQPILAEIEQLFDLNSDPKSKARLLSGMVNVAQCPNCGFHGQLSIPIVYHDPAKELLLTYFPPELGLPVNDQERMIGPLITQTVNRLAPEKRKAYILQPRTMFTMQTMIETVLEADGITHEMIENQQKRVTLLERLLSTSPESRKQIIQQEETAIDQDIFALLSRLLQSSATQGDQKTAQQLAELQQDLLTQTQVGRDLYAQSREVEATIKSLQEASQKGMTREKLLDLVINAKSEASLAALVSLARNGMDYTFFQQLSDKIEHCQGDKKKSLLELREKLLSMTQDVDKAIEQEQEATRKMLDELLAAENVEEVMSQNLELVTPYFVELIKSEVQTARQQGNLERSGKLQQIAAIIQKASTPPPEIGFIEELLSIENKVERQKKLEENKGKVTPEFLQVLTSIITQSESQGQPTELINELKEIYRSTLRISMQNNLK
jgi:hypothetical protein